MKRQPAKHVCRACGKHRALFHRPNHFPQVAADRDHDLCFRCYRSWGNRLRAGHERRRALGAAA